MNSGCTSSGRVVAVHRSRAHTFSKFAEQALEVVAGIGVLGDAHAGETVRHRSRVAKDPLAPNLRQVHLIAVETLCELRVRGFDVNPGDLGENVTTEGVDLSSLLTGTRLVFDGDVVIEVTGLRNPCHQIENFRRGLLDQVRTVAEDGTIERRVGVMGIVLVGGRIASGSEFVVVAPPEGAAPLVVV